jgi:hypothetical protein
VRLRTNNLVCVCCMQVVMYVSYTLVLCVCTNSMQSVSHLPFCPLKGSDHLQQSEHLACLPLRCRKVRQMLREILYLIFVISHRRRYIKCVLHGNNLYCAILFSCVTKVYPRCEWHNQTIDRIFT